MMHLLTRDATAKAKEGDIEAPVLPPEAWDVEGVSPARPCCSIHTSCSIGLVLPSASR
jgi:hypothetical protein